MRCVHNMQFPDQLKVENVQKTCFVWLHCACRTNHETDRHGLNKTTKPHLKCQAVATASLANTASDIEANTAFTVSRANVAANMTASTSPVVLSTYGNDGH